MGILSMFALFTGFILMPQLPQSPQITIDGFPLDSDATRIVNYRWSGTQSQEFIATMLCENGGMDITAISKTKDHGLCQLNYRYNKNLIDDPRRLSGWQYQAQVCMEKRLAVKDKNLWACYKQRNRFLDRIHMEGKY